MNSSSVLLEESESMKNIFNVLVASRIRKRRGWSGSQNVLCSNISPSPSSKTIPDGASSFVPSLDPWWVHGWHLPSCLITLSRIFKILLPKRMRASPLVASSRGIMDQTNRIKTKGLGVGRDFEEPWSWMPPVFIICCLSCLQLMSNSAVKKPKNRNVDLVNSN